MFNFDNDLSFLSLTGAPENEYIYKVAVREKRKKRPTSAADSYEYDPNEGVAGKMTVELIPIEKSPSIPELKGHFS